jgi:hypothetical protein
VGVQATQHVLFLLEEIEELGLHTERPLAELLARLEAVGPQLAQCLRDAMEAIQSPDDLLTLVSLLQVRRSPFPIQDNR